MKSFWQLSEDLGAPGAPPGGADAGLPGGGPMGGGMPPMGGGGAMGGGMGGPSPMGGAPAGGAMPNISPTQLKTSDVWSVWKRLLEGKPVNKPEKSSGQKKPDPLQNGPQPSQPSPQPPAPTAAQPSQPSPQPPM